MSIAQPLRIKTHSIVLRHSTKICIHDLGLFIDMCKRNNLDHKRIILDIVKEKYDDR